MPCSGVDSGLCKGVTRTLGKTRVEVPVVRLSCTRSNRITGTCVGRRPTNHNNLAWHVPYFLVGRLSFFFSFSCIAQSQIKVKSKRVACCCPSHGSCMAGACAWKRAPCMDYGVRSSSFLGFQGPPFPPLLLSLLFQMQSLIRRENRQRDIKMEPMASASPVDFFMRQG